MNTGAELNYLLVLFLVLSVLTALVRSGLHILNVSHLRYEGRKVPREFAGAIDAYKVEEIRDYSTATGRLEAIRHLFFDLFQIFGFESQVIYAGIFIPAVFLRPAAFFLSPVRAMISRRFERQPDDFSSAMMGGPEALIEPLERLASRNMTNLHPHPAYAWFFSSHPPVLERIRRLENREEMHEQSLPGSLSPESEPLPGAHPCSGKHNLKRACHKTPCFAHGPDERKRASRKTGGPS